MKNKLLLLVLLSLALSSCNKDDSATGPLFDPPSSPQTLTSFAGNSRITLNWLPPSNIGGPYAYLTGYRIYRGTSAGGSVYANVSGTTISFTDSSVINGTGYYYSVTALNEAGESPHSNEVLSAAGNVPSPPLNPAAVSNSGKIELSWNIPANPNGTIINYKIYRGLSSNTEVFYRNVPYPYELYVDSNVTAGTRYYYYFTAVNSFGEGQSAAEINAIP